MNSLTLPDVASETRSTLQPLSWVGMQGIALPVQLKRCVLSAWADAGVSLDDGESRGIHMSRLYLALEALEHQELTPALLRQLLERFLVSHEGLSACAYIRLKFDYMLKRPALVSPAEGWKRYPVVVEAKIEGGMFHVEQHVEIPYSSTCPCSAALARQLIQQQFLDDFANRPLDSKAILQWLGSTSGIVATPHSQRSRAIIKIRLLDTVENLPIESSIDTVERALGTAVQTAVKRADEQAFALANGQNLMFCEDAARRLHQALCGLEGCAGFDLRVEHAESLHAHDAVAASRWQW
ncbi:GTP cyclohydrolase I FolE2 [Pseudomonas sp. S75]|uniref:GTP cyclohydrolase FolE2 n=1 Tax=unclassified Pseudomonas TaxID=196821 RepID=UPI0019035BE5|nr:MULTISPECIES: GTP cyclohydrolase FolE2 [unclassified Pseudomonas]MBJ9974426.1 GTP cyclohydrolase I FolE2 [Pseudomonas sp. S30]MBK0154265.1 GTP cyclohydrolase I FolE2 [Pseudomonas sp. S75]